MERENSFGNPQTKGVKTSFHSLKLIQTNPVGSLEYATFIGPPKWIVFILINTFIYFIYGERTSCGQNASGLPKEKEIIDIFFIPPPLSSPRLLLWDPLSPLLFLFISVFFFFLKILLFLFSLHKN